MYQAWFLVFLWLLVSNDCFTFRSIPILRSRDFAMASSSGWGSLNWNWGYAVGEAHTQAARVRSALSNEVSREAFLLHTVPAVDGASGESGRAVALEEVKMVLALRFQLMGHMGGRAER